VAKPRKGTRFYCTTSYDNAIEALYKNRQAPLIPLEENVVGVCEDLTSRTALSAFFRDLSGKGGIYVFTAPLPSTS